MEMTSPYGGATLPPKTKPVKQIRAKSFRASKKPENRTEPASQQEGGQHQ